MDIQYFAVDGFEGRYFSCNRYGTMTAESCARNFKEAPDAIRRGRLEGCIGCHVGNFHAHPDTPAAPIESRTSVAYREVCVRCRRGGSDAKLIGRIRLVREHTACVSCFNREREVLKGKNSKGGRPKKWRGLFYAHIASVVDGVLTIEKFDHPVRDRIEMMLTLLRRKQGPKVMAWTAARSIVRAGDAA